MVENLKAERLVVLAQSIAEKTPAFFETKGPGRGDRATALFMRTLRQAATEMFGKDYSEYRVRSDAGLAIDFYFPEEATAVEVALTLHLSRTEYELDIFKCLLAQEAGADIRRLIFVGKPGSIARQSSPSGRAIADFARRRFGLRVDVLDLRPSVA